MCVFIKGKCVVALLATLYPWSNMLLQQLENFGPVVHSFGATKKDVFTPKRASERVC